MRLPVLAAVMVVSGVLAVRADPITATVAGIAAWYASIGVVGQLVVQLAVGVAFSLASMGIQYLLSGSVKSLDQSQREAPGVTIPERDGLLERRRIYGTSTVAGGVFFQKTMADGGSTPNWYLLGLALSEGVCDGLVSVIINGVECGIDSQGLPTTEPWFSAGSTWFKISFRNGEPDQTLDPLIAQYFPGESADFRQRGVCTVVVALDFGIDSDHHTELWGAGGIPQLAFRVRGVRLFDPRVASCDVSDPTTYVWSDNATLCEVDWLMSEMGFGISPDEIDWDTVVASANIDDMWVQTLSGPERRGTINGEVSSSEANDQVLQTMALQNRAMVGKANGLYFVRAEGPIEPVGTMHQGLLVGDMSYQSEPDIRSAINRVNVQFYPATRYNQRAEIYYQDDALIAAAGQEFAQRINLRFCDSPAAAQRLAFSMVEENKVGKSVTVNMDIASLIAAGKPGQLLSAGDVLWFELQPPYDSVNHLYKVTQVEVNGDFTVNIAMSGTSTAVFYGWDVSLETEFEEIQL